MVERSAVVQRILNLFDKPVYLEIGVDAGETFRSVQAAHKVAVDPAFKFTPPESNQTTQYCAVTSDEYFGSVCPDNLYFDVVYVDGLHTFEQTMRDLMNALLRLKPHGVVILDDVLPASYHAALPSLSEAFKVRDHVTTLTPGASVDNTWMGDVYKLVFFIETFVQQATYATVAENHGQLILWRSARPKSALTERTMLDVALLGFADTVTKRLTFKIRPFEDIIKDVAASHGSGQTLAKSAA